MTAAILQAKRPYFLVVFFENCLQKLVIRHAAGLGRLRSAFSLRNFAQMLSSPAA